MRERLILLPGWAIGPAALEPLRDALLERAPHLTVEIEPLPALEQSGAWLDELDARLPRDSWLAGWSLGGMLAAQLAARRGDACRGLIGLCSNMNFRDRDDWPHAMPREVFSTFHEACRLDPAQTLKRFTLLVAQGARDARTLARQLQVTQLASTPKVLDAGLRLLDVLDIRAAVQGYAGPQLYLFGGRDALVPAGAAEALLEWLPDVEVQVFDEASHGLPLERPDEVAASILGFMREGDDV
ncbi:alpha/beta fold hydrolase [Metapseudomonas resinovorans]|uniref:Putative biotin biosynthesis protein BioH n=1 Tax=Metapseudomonas resinovorans NBRC 106553 TaxID=1245471 RepID=S6AC89_METRE|nr:alpha/beta fold hydrolase [Pseudomonas resinovorans]BAN46207.1 putative biotin biosynthesis protein BioH [Pseudomonas resinovorans NBRC 106553]